MFTGIVAAKGKVLSLTDSGGDTRVRIDCGDLSLVDVVLGDSIAVNGCCLTVVDIDEQAFGADVSNETLQCTTLGNLQEGATVNLEKAMQATDRFGGHIVSGHVDCVGELLSKKPDGDSLRLEFSVPQKLQHYIAAKGSVCIDGTSLTVNKVNGNQFSINVIPHTQHETIIGEYTQGQQVNIEVDLIARYLERLMQGADQESNAPGLTREFLQEHGYK